METFIAAVLTICAGIWVGAILLLGLTLPAIVAASAAPGL